MEVFGQGELVREYCGFCKYKWTLTHDDVGDLHPISMITGFITFLIVIPSTSMINLEWLQIWIAPKVWLIEYAQSLIK